MFSGRTATVKNSYSYEILASTNLWGHKTKEPKHEIENQHRDLSKSIHAFVLTNLQALDSLYSTKANLNSYLALAKNAKKKVSFTYYQVQT